MSVPTAIAALAMTALRLYGSLAKRPFLRATSWVVNLRREQLLTFGDTIAISTPPGTTSGLLPLDGICANDGIDTIEQRP